LEYIVAAKINAAENLNNKEKVNKIQIRFKVTKDLLAMNHLNLRTSVVN
jgi:hypothetical protein